MQKQTGNQLTNDYYVFIIVNNEVVKKMMYAYLLLTYILSNGLPGPEERRGTFCCSSFRCASSALGRSIHKIFFHSTDVETMLTRTRR